MASWLLVLGLLAIVFPQMSDAGTSPVTCSLQYNLPADIPVPVTEADNDTFQQFGWDTFLALNAPSVGGQISTTGDNVPQWASWSSTVDLLSCQGTPTPQGCVCAAGGCTQSGTRYYPTVCQSVPDYQNYRVIAQVGKVDDSFQQAATGGLSEYPLIDRFGHFIRYEILLSPATYDTVIQNQLYEEASLRALTTDINLPCGDASYTGGDPANAQMGSLVTKLAWMDVTDEVQNDQIDASMYHLQQVLVYNPFYRNSTGLESCDLRTMALVGMHFEHKTVNQPNWIWTTFEHQLNAPDCTQLMPGPGSQVPNTACPTSVTANYNFFGQLCNGDAAACAECNTGPASNALASTGPTACTNPISSGPGWCLDQPPNPTGGVSMLCRQVSTCGNTVNGTCPGPGSYPQAGAWNTACQDVIGPSSVWSNYMLISSQWSTSAITPGCRNVALEVVTQLPSPPGMVNEMIILPPIMTAGGALRPHLGNTSMESYDRSNCTGCHAKASLTNTVNNTTYNISTDFMYWLDLEVVIGPEIGLPVPTPMRTPSEDDSGCQTVAPAQRRRAWVLLLPAAMLLGLRRRARFALAGQKGKGLTAGGAEDAEKNVLHSTRPTDVSVAWSTNSPQTGPFPFCSKRVR